MHGRRRPMLRRLDLQNCSASEEAARLLGELVGVDDLSVGNVDQLRLVFSALPELQGRPLRKLQLGHQIIGLHEVLSHPRLRDLEQFTTFNSLVGREDLTSMQANLTNLRSLTIAEGEETLFAVLKTMPHLHTFAVNTIHRILQQIPLPVNITSLTVRHFPVHSNSLRFFSEALRLQHLSIHFAQEGFAEDYKHMALETYRQLRGQILEYFAGLRELDTLTVGSRRPFRSEADLNELFRHNRSDLKWHMISHDEGQVQRLTMLRYPAANQMRAVVTTSLLALRNDVEFRRLAELVEDRVEKLELRASALAGEVQHLLDVFHFVGLQVRLQELEVELEVKTGFLLGVRHLPMPMIHLRKFELTARYIAPIIDREWIGVMASWPALEELRLRNVPLGQYINNRSVTDELLQAMTTAGGFPSLTLLSLDYNRAETPLSKASQLAERRMLREIQRRRIPVASTSTQAISDWFSRLALPITRESHTDSSATAAAASSAPPAFPSSFRTFYFGSVLPTVDRESDLVVPDEPQHAQAGENGDRKSGGCEVQ